MGVQSSSGLSKKDIQRMQDEAEKYAAEVANNIETSLWSAEQQLEEHKEQISKELSNEIKNKIDELKAARDNGDIEGMEGKNKELQKCLMKIGEAVYINQQKNQSQSNEEQTIDGEVKE